MPYNEAFTKSGKRNSLSERLSWGSQPSPMSYHRENRDCKEGGSWGRGMSSDWADVWNDRRGTRYRSQNEMEEGGISHVLLVFT